MKCACVLERLRENIGKVIVGKGEIIEMMLVALLTDGHVLIEDVPGAGKTVLAKSFAASVGASFKRIQFTPDLLPSDITGVKYFNMKTSEFEFIRGPVFANVVLADEINRATPKTQAGLLECMEEGQITVEGETYALPYPLMVIATQNPIESMGVFPLPEAQLDRFMMKLRMGYPTREESITILSRFSKGHNTDCISAVIDTDEITAAKSEIVGVYVHDDIFNYIAEIVEYTRYKQGVILGASTRSSIDLLKASKGLAAVRGRDYVIPDDVKACAVPVLAHRLVLKTTLRTTRGASEDVVNEILNYVTVPTEAVEKYRL